MLNLLAALETSYPITAIRTIPTLYALVNAAHILGLGVMIGAILTVDVRVAGIWKPAGWREGLQIAGPIAAFGLLLTLLTGLALFAVRPGHYLGNEAFLIKLGLVTCAMINVAVFHWVLVRKTEAGPPLVLRISAVVSVFAWCGALFAGRFIAFMS